MYDIKEVNDEFRTKLMEVHKLIKHMRENNMPETDLDGIESLLIDLGVCHRKLNNE